MPIRAGYEQVASLGAGELGTCRQGREAEAGPWFKWVPRPGNEHMQTLRFPHNGQNETLKMNRAGLSPCLTSSSGLPSLRELARTQGPPSPFLTHFQLLPPCGWSGMSLRRFCCGCPLWLESFPQDLCTLAVSSRLGLSSDVLPERPSLTAIAAKVIHTHSMK